MSRAPAPFDRDITLSELLRAVPRAKLESALTRTLGNDWRLEEADEVPVLGSDASANAGTTAVSLHLDIEPIGTLRASGERECVEAAAKWLEMVLVSSYRYQMAADLHLETVHADYEALQRQHAALQESEARHRELAGQLEQRVEAQVAVIERAQRHLYQAEKMASTGSLAAGMAHEINNPIGFIRSNLNTASGYVDTTRQVLNAFRHGDAAEAGAIWRELDMDFVLDDFSGLLAESIAGADRIARIVANLKAYASVDSATATAIDLNDAARAVVAIISDQLPANVRLEIDLQPLPHFVCDQGRLNQVLFSLLQNARQSLGPDGGLIRLASRAAGDEIRIAVSDNGCGIKPEVLNRIFDPFFTTRDVGGGMGLGLTVSRDIVSAHHGRIEIETTVGAGSVFTVCLPAAAGAGRANLSAGAS